MSPTLKDYYAKTGRAAPIMTEAAGKLCIMYGNGAVADLPGGSLELVDYAQIKGQSTEAMLESFSRPCPRK